MMAFGVPRHDYNLRGGSAAGRDFKEVCIGVAAGRGLMPISRNLSLQAQHGHAGPGGGR